MTHSLTLPSLTSHSGVECAPPRVETRARWNWNRRIAWLSFSTGIATGLVFGLWSFDGPFSAPGLLGEYTDVARRLARLGHIAFFGLGFLNLLMVREAPRLGLGPRVERTAAISMNIGNVGLPLTLLGASVIPALKYALPLPALSVFVALILVTIGVWRAEDRP